MDRGIGTFDALVARSRDVVVVMQDLGSQRSFGDADMGLVILKNTIFSQGVMGQEGCWGCLFNWNALEGVDDGLELGVFGDCSLDLLG